MTSLGHELGGPEKVAAMLKAQGVSLILKSIEVKFRRPVTYPDTVRLLFSMPVYLCGYLNDQAAFNRLQTSPSFSGRQAGRGDF
jgi:hypothetical protein